jgi:hypothetical protein
MHHDYKKQIIVSELSVKRCLEENNFGSTMKKGTYPNRI